MEVQGCEWSGVRLWNTRLYLWHRATGARYGPGMPNWVPYPYPRYPFVRHRGFTRTRFKPYTSVCEGVRVEVPLVWLVDTVRVLYIRYETSAFPWESKWASVEIYFSSSESQSIFPVIAASLHFFCGWWDMLDMSTQMSWLEVVTALGFSATLVSCTIKLLMYIHNSVVMSVSV